MYGFYLQSEICTTTLSGEITEFFLPIVYPFFALNCKMAFCSGTVRFCRYYTHSYNTRTMLFSRFRAIELRVTRNWTIVVFFCVWKRPLFYDTLKMRIIRVYAYRNDSCSVKLREANRASTTFVLRQWFQTMIRESLVFTWIYKELHGNSSYFLLIFWLSIQFGTDEA
jgi:hypothetical protein